ncbi:MAG TPA: hypothetical protein VHH73_17380, partial [Verrucomicrobiae bacterium]|nr:hypothetical protein [Verrucomicrobiae bacterium]
MIDELDASATGERRKKIRRRWLLALVAVVAIGAVPAYHGLKTWRAHRLDAQGESLLAARKYQEAMQRAQVAVQLAPADARSLRLMARLLGIGGSDASLILWNKLLAGPGATPGDRNEMLQTALHLGRLDVVENHLKVALDQPPVTAETLRLAAAYSEARGARPQAIKFATDLLQLDPNDRDALLLLSRQLLNSEDSKQRQQAKDILFSLADRQDQSGVDALLLLANNVPLTPAEEQRCLDRLEKHPLKQPDHRFVIANLKIRLAPQNEAAIVTQAVQSTPADDSSLTTLVRWLLQQKEYGRILQLLTRQHAFTSMDLTIPYLDALAFQKRWPELQEILTKEKLPLDPGLIALYRMRAARELHEDRLVPMYWDQALSLANEKPGLLWEIARYAEALGEPAQAMRAYRQLARDN